MRRWKSAKPPHARLRDRKSTRLNSSHGYISYAVFCLKKKLTPSGSIPPRAPFSQAGQAAAEPSRAASLGLRCTLREDPVAAPPLRARFSFFFNDTATTEIYTLSLHDALPIFASDGEQPAARAVERDGDHPGENDRSEEHTSELQSRLHLVCRLLLEKTKS